MREIKKTFLSLSTPFLFTLFKAMDELHSPFVEIVYHHFYYCVITCLTRTIKFSGSQFHPLLRSKVLPFMALVPLFFFCTTLLFCIAPFLYALLLDCKLERLHLGDLCFHFNI